MIDENKLMEEVRQWKRKVDKDCGEMPNVSYLTGYISALSVVEGMIAKQPTIDQYGTWIPVTERLPESDYETWNTRKLMERIVERLEERASAHERIMLGCANVEERHLHCRISDEYKQVIEIVKGGGVDEVD